MKNLIKLFNSLILKRFSLFKFPYFYPLLLVLISLAFSWKFFLKGLVPIPADIIVGIYHPWRDHIWNGLVAGVPFKNGLLSDVISIIYPWRIYGIDLIKNGQFPLWIPFALAGTPLLANFQSAVLYPLNILFFVFSNVNAWSIYIILQPVMASVFMYLYLRNLGLKDYFSAIGGLIFAFSGFSMVWWEYGIVGHTGLWLPLILLSIDKYSSTNSLKWIIIGSLALVFSIFAGYPQITMLLLAVIFLYMVFHLWQKRDIKNIFPFSAIVVLGIVLSSVQLFPGV